MPTRIELENMPFGELVRFADTLQRKVERLEGLLTVDEKTGLMSQRGIVQALNSLFTSNVALGNMGRWSGEERRHEGAGPVQAVGGALAVIDLIGFKGVNEVLGRTAGDILLNIVGNTIAGKVRDEDRVARWEGDEYVVYFDGQPRKFAEKRIAEIRESIKKITFDLTSEEILQRFNREFIVDFRYRIVFLDRKLDFTSLVRSMMDEMKQEEDHLRLGHLQKKE